MKLNELLGTEFPFIQGGMANIATGEFAAAVSNAGALGLIGAGGMTPDSLRENIRRCRELTDRPFGVNVMLMHPQVEEMVRVVAEERVMVVTTGAGNPGAYIPVWKEYGAKVLPVVPAVAVAKVAERAGATMMELEQYTLGSLRRAVFDGDTKTRSLMAGQVAGMLHEIKPLRQIFEELSAGCDRRLAELRG